MSRWPAELRGRTAWRLALTVRLVYMTRASTNVVRETCLALAPGEPFSVRVDA